MRRTSIFKLALWLSACGPEVELLPPDAGGSGSLCPARIVPRAACSVRELVCPSGSEGVTCVCRAEAWVCQASDAG